MGDIESLFGMTLLSFSSVYNCSFEGEMCLGVVFKWIGRNGPGSLRDLPELRGVDMSGNELYLDQDYEFGDMGKAKSLVYVNLSSNRHPKVYRDWPCQALAGVVS